MKTFMKKPALLATLCLSASFGANASLINATYSLEECEQASGRSADCIINNVTNTAFSQVNNGPNYGGLPEDLYFGNAGLNREIIESGNIAHSTTALWFLEGLFGQQLRSSSADAGYDLKYATASNVDRAIFDIFAGDLSAGDTVNLFTHVSGDTWDILNVEYTAADLEVNVKSNVLIDPNDLLRYNHIEQEPAFLVTNDSFKLVTEVPEPASYAIFGLSLLGLGAMRRRNKNKAA